MRRKTNGTCGLIAFLWSSTDYQFFLRHSHPKYPHLLWSSVHETQGASRGSRWHYTSWGNSPRPLQPSDTNTGMFPTFHAIAYFVKGRLSHTKQCPHPARPIPFKRDRVPSLPKPSLGTGTSYAKAKPQRPLNSILRYQRTPWTPQGLGDLFQSVMAGDKGLHALWAAVVLVCTHLKWKEPVLKTAVTSKGHTLLSTRFHLLFHHLCRR